METTFKVQINEASILNWLKQSYNSLEFTESQIKDFIKSSKLIHADETGIKINGKLCWNHVICTDALTYQYVHAKRGQQAILSQESILPSYNGTIMHDFWSSYFGLDQAEHVVCGAHILRELNSQIEIGSIWAARFAKFYLNLFDSSRATNKRNKQQILKAYDKILKKGLREEPPPQRTGSRGRLKNSKGMNLLNRLIDYKHSVLAFAFDESIPFTNNQAERDIRHCKTKQKISGCFRSFEGAQYYARISSITSTLKKNSLNILECFRGLFESGRLSLNLT
jgi:transposase